LKHEAESRNGVSPHQVGAFFTRVSAKDPMTVKLLTPDMTTGFVMYGSSTGLNQQLTMAIRGLHCMPVVPRHRLAFYESLIPGAAPPVDCECECWKWKNKDWLTKLVDQLIGHVRFR